jgi:hypothetical protein
MKIGLVIREDRRRTIHDVCNMLGISHGTYRRILTEDLYTRSFAAKFVPRLLNDYQKTEVTFCVQGPARSGQKGQKRPS